MRLHTYPSVSRGIVLILAFAAAVFLSYFGLRNALAAHYVDLQTRQGYEQATRLEPGDYRNWYLLGRYWQLNFEEADTARATRAYLTSLSLNPRSAKTWMDLATTYESDGNLPAARKAYLQAKKEYPISPEVAWRYGNFLLRQRELDAAFAEMRHAIEADHERGAEAFSRCFRAEPNVVKLMDLLLPVAGDVYVEVISDQVSEGHLAVALTLWERLATARPHLRLQDAFPLVGELVKQKRYREAARVWDQAAALAGFGDLPGPAGSLVWDGGFESGVWGGNFTWFYPAYLRAVQIDLDTQEKHSGSQSLRLSFDGRYNLYLKEICHNALVEPSTNYRFSAWVRTKELRTDQGIRFQLHPLGTSDVSDVVTPDVHGSEAWRQVEASWTSGPDVHEIEVCIFRYPSDQEGQRIRGTAWIDDVSLVPAAREHGQP